MDNDEFEDVFQEASYLAFKNSETDEEALGTLAFTAGTDVETVIRRIAFNCPEEVARFALTGILLGMLDAGRADMALTVIHDMAHVAAELGYKPE